MENYGTNNKIGKKARDGSIDFVRGLATILVVLGHSIQYGSGNGFYSKELYFDNILFQFIYSFHMPMFALLSGYLFFYSMKKGAWDVIKKQVFALIIPIFVWKGLEVIFRTAVEVFQGEFSLIHILKSYFGGVLYSFWFLWAIFWCSMIVVLVDKVLQGGQWIYAGILAALLIAPSRMNAYLYAYMYPYFVMGYLYHNACARGFKLSKRNRYLVLLMSAAVFLVLFVFYDYDCFVYTTKISLLEASSAARQLGINAYRWLIGSTGSIMVITGLKILHDRFENAGIVRAIETLGQISLGIYVLNSYTNQIVMLRITKGCVPNSILWILETFVCLLLYYVIVWCIKKVPAANKLLLGGR